MNAETSSTPQKIKRRFLDSIMYLNCYVVVRLEYKAKEKVFVYSCSQTVKTIDFCHDRTTEEE